ncbi:MAG: hypothetical protein JOZ78_10470 [Chroococcidiopsidaceae cyanobacterium CP_BM_ER_R8_30]|nr:hypothetical protein [Chroococcidiopsidaceae cyanobacterium CP_BM_ER_R8_30]
MATDYILFIHGVNNREVREQPEYADQFFALMQKSTADRKRDLKKVALYWGDVNKDAEAKLLAQLQSSPLWDQIWFRTFRERQLLQFVGDAALYISSYIGSKVVNVLKTQALQEIKNAQPNDRLHLVTHSWGTVILFDILFADRWDNPKIPGHDDVMAIRDTIFGISGKDPNPLQGIQLASIHTMGSPIAIFSLTDVAPGRDNAEGVPSSSSGHDITPKLQLLLERLHQARQGEKLPWRNFVHPGDPVAYPLNELMTSLVDGDKQYLDIADIITHEAGLFDYITEPFSQTALALLHGGDAHGSYWHSEKVVQEISSVLKKGVTELQDVGAGKEAIFPNSKGVL